MRSFIFFALVGLILQPTCGYQYFVKIQPASEGEVFQMKVGDMATFELTTFKKTEEGEVPVQVEIDKTFWNFDKRILEKRYSDNYAIQLKAIKIGTATLEVTTFIKNSQDIKNLTILVTK